jgi:hypothetical protein
MTFNVLTVRAFEQDYQPGRLYPQLPEEDGQIVAPETGDGSTSMCCVAKHAVVKDLRGRIHTTVLQTYGPTRVMVADCRIAVSCEKFTKGSTWVGSGAGVLIAATAMAASAARARHQRQGKLMVGHLRYEWISRIGVNRGRCLSLEYVANGLPRGLEMQFFDDISVTAAQDIARRVAAFRLQHVELAIEHRAVLERLRAAKVLQPAKGKWDYYDLPGSLMVRTG